MWRKPTWLSTMLHETCYRLAQQKAMKAPFICLLHRTESYVTLRYVTFRECLVLVFVFLMTPFCERVGFFCSWKYIIESEVWKSTVLTDKNLASIYAGSFDCCTFAVFLFTLTFITHHVFRALQIQKQQRVQNVDIWRRQHICGWFEERNCPEIKNGEVDGRLPPTDHQPSDWRR